MKRLDGIKTCVFDGYGTLFDFASAAARCQDVPDQKLSALTSLWREKQLQYTWLRSLEGNYADFWQLTGDGWISPSTASTSRRPSCTGS